MPCRFFSALFFASFLSYSLACGGEAKHDGGYAKEERVEYLTQKGSKSVYLLQVPRGTLREDAPIHIYLHGASGDETQGMDAKWAAYTFSRLRPLMDKWGWIYVTPRDEPCEKLIESLEKRFGKRDIYISGASRGGAWAYRQIQSYPEKYKGVVLICPAIQRQRLVAYRGGEFFNLPTWIDSASGDRNIHKQAILLAEKLGNLKRIFHFHNIPGGNHGVPVEVINWEKALTFVSTAKLPPLFDIAEIKDWPKFLDTIIAAGEGQADSAGKRLWNYFSAQDRAYAKRDHAREPVNSVIKGPVIKAMDRAISAESFYDEKSWRGIALSEEVKALLKEKSEDKLSHEKLLLLNRRLVECALGDLIEKHVEIK